MKRFLLLSAVLAMFQLQAQQIEEYRYWINDDAAATTVSGIGPAQLVNLTEDLVLPTLTKDFNTITLQFKDTNDVYSVPVSRIFTRNTGPVIGYEYWIDDNIADRVSGTITAGTSVELTSDIPLCLTAGTHVFAIRFGGTSGTWSVPVTRQFTSVGSPDTDGDGICDALDACPLLADLINGDPCDDGDANTVNDVVTNCYCAGTLLGDDCEGVPGGPAQPGTPCDDNNACTINDLYQANCSCAGTLQDTDGDGICDANDYCPGLAGQVGDACDDGDACTAGDVITAGCVCAGNFQDTDNDGACDANDGCPTDPNKVAPGVCGCGVADTDSDSDGAPDCNDGCVNDPDKVAPGTCGCGNAEPGTPCDDANVNTINDVIGTNCVCAGTPNGNTCQPTQLTTTPDPVISCGITGAQLNGSTILYAVNVPGANRYQFSFTNIPGQPAYSRNIATPTRSLALYTWATTPLKKGRTYQVRVRASFDNGATWCPYDAACNVSISNNAASLLRDVDARDVAEGASNTVFELFPNPTSDGAVELRYTNTELEEGMHISMELLDALGRVVMSEQGILVQGHWKAHIQLPAERSTGLYVVRLIAGGQATHHQLMVR